MLFLNIRNILSAGNLFYRIAVEYNGIAHAVLRIICIFFCYERLNGRPRSMFRQPSSCSHM